MVTNDASNAYNRYGNPFDLEYDEAPDPFVSTLNTYGNESYILVNPNVCRVKNLHKCEG